MAEHFMRGAAECVAFCNTCMRSTKHAVSGGRRGRCMEHGPQGYSKAQIRRLEEQERERQAPSLFKETQ